MYFLRIAVTGDIVGNRQTILIRSRPKVLVTVPIMYILRYILSALCKNIYFVLLVNYVKCNINLH